MRKFAVLSDSGCNVPPEVAKTQGIYILPLKLQFGGNTYRDGVDITPEEVYAVLPTDLPKTSLPSGEEITALFDEIRADGYTDLLCVTLSCELSGTNNMLRIMAEEYEGLNIRLVDTKNIGIGAGFISMYAQGLANAGASLETAYQKTSERIYNSRVFFCVDTLEYLRKGGRIGGVASFLGTHLNLKPIISCNKEGIYYTVGKVRGKKQAVEKMIALAKEHVKEASVYRICACNGGASKEEFKAFFKQAKQAFPEAREVYATDISPTLGVHTGPGLLGVGVQILG